MSRLSKTVEEFTYTELAEAKNKILDLHHAGLLGSYSTLVAVKALDFMVISQNRYRVLRLIKKSVVFMIAGMVTSCLLRIYFN